MHLKKAVVIAVCLMPMPALSKDLPWYAGVAGGEARTSRELVANRESTITNAGGIATDFDSRGTAGKIFAGRRLNDWLAVEVSCADLGRHRMATTLFTSGDPQFPAAILINREIDAFATDLALSLPARGPLAVSGRVGAARTRLTADATLSGNIVFTNGDPTQRMRRASRRDTVLHYGVGAEWRWRPDLALRLEWERYHDVGKAFAIGGAGTTGKADTDLLSLGATMRF